MWEKREQIEIKEVEMAILFGRERLLKAHLRIWKYTIANNQDLTIMLQCRYTKYLKISHKNTQ